MEELAAKGVVVAPLVAALKSWRKANPGVSVPGLRDEDLRFFEHERVLATSYYDIDLYHRLVAAAAQLVFGGDRGAPAVMGAGAAQMALDTVYRAYLKESDPVATLAATPRIWGSHYRGSVATIELPDASAAVNAVGVFTVRGYGPMPRLMQQINESWLAECVRMSGGTNVVCSCRGAAELVFRVTWDTPRT